MFKKMNLSLQQRLRYVIPKPIRATYFGFVQAYHRYQLTHGLRHERHVCQVLRSCIKPGGTCVDVGANIGIMTALMAKLVGPSGKVFAFEPHPSNGVRIESTLRMCRVRDRVELNQVAVSDGTCHTLQLYAGRRHSHSEWNTTGFDADGKPAEAVMAVPAVSLDAVIPSHQRIDLIKIDVEGAESQVLAGMKQILMRWHPILVIECHSEENWKACADLSAHGYQLFDMNKRLLDPSGSIQSAHILAIKAASSHRLAA